MGDEKRVFSEVQEGKAQTVDVVTNVVYTTSDYGKFKLSKFNRNVLLKKEMLEQARQGFLAPVIVNENFVVIDGQHRLTASEKEGVPVKYIVIQGLNKDDIIRMNTVQKPWSLLNYIESFANEGREEFVKLVNLIAGNYSNVTVTIAIALNAPTHSNLMVKLIKSGEFKFFDFEKTVEFLQYYKRFREETKTPKKSTVATALYELFRLENFDRNRMIEKTIATELNEDIKVKTYRHTDILKTLIEAYNQKLSVKSKHYIDFHVTSLGHLIIDEDRAEWASKKPIELTGVSKDFEEDYLESEF